MWNNRRAKRILTSFSVVTATTLGIFLTDIIEENTVGSVSINIINKASAQTKTDLNKDKTPSETKQQARKTQETKTIWGDVNSDNKIDKTDVKLIKEYIKGKIKKNKINVRLADVNGDGEVDQKDVKYVKDYLKGKPSADNRTGKIKKSSLLSGFLSSIRTGGAIFPRNTNQQSVIEKNDNLSKKQSVSEDIEIRSDGKVVCNTLREKRLELARINNITFKSDMCSNVEPCAGTCPKCEAEAEYLKAQLKKIPKEQIIYPKLDVSAFR